MSNCRLVISDFALATCLENSPDPFVILYKIKSGELIVQSIQDYIKSNIALVEQKLPIDRLVSQSYLVLGAASTRAEAESLLDTLRGQLQ